jgi:hypothetical protein
VNGARWPHKAGPRPARWADVRRRFGGALADATYLLSLAQELLARMRRRGVRVDLRPLADVRNLAWIPILWLLALHTLRFLSWLVMAVVTGATEGGAAGRHVQQQRQEYRHGQGHL